MLKAIFCSAYWKETKTTKLLNTENGTAEQLRAASVFLSDWALNMPLLSKALQMHERTFIVNVNGWTVLCTCILVSRRLYLSKITFSYYVACRLKPVERCFWPRTINPRNFLLIKFSVCMDLIPNLACPQTVTGCSLDQWTGVATLERLYHPTGWLILPQSPSCIIKLYISVHTAFYRVQQQERLHGRMRIGMYEGG